LNKADRKALGEYVRWVANEVGLRDWTLHLMYDDGLDEGAIAMVTPTDGMKHAQLRFCHDFRHLAPEKQRQAVVHELLHCHHSAASNVLRLDLKDHLADSTHWVAWTGYKRQMEFANDAIAEVLAPHLPLIKWPKEKKRRTR
jgi:hypothetical protein